jgi:hypothetical protein
MSPCISNGEEVLIKSCALSEVSLGEVVLFIDKNSHELTLHRLIEKPFRTKGDNSYFYEENTPDSFLGKAVLIKKNDWLILIPNHKWIVFLSKKASKKGNVSSYLFKLFLRISLYSIRLSCGWPKKRNISESLLNHL